VYTQTSESIKIAVHLAKNPKPHLSLMQMCLLGLTWLAQRADLLFHKDPQTGTTDETFNSSFRIKKMTAYCQRR
jgi:hypothetical protein